MKERVVWVERLRIAAMLSVVMLHVLSKGISTMEVNTMEWEIYNAGRCFVKWGVPVFVMISGNFLLEKKETTAQELKGKIGHIFWVLVFWLCVYAGVSMFNYYLSHGTLNRTAAHGAVQILCFGYSHLWYLYMLLGLYVVLPFLRKLTDKKLIEYYIILFVFFNVFYNILQNVELDIASDLLKFINLFQIRNMSGFTGYLFLGYYLCHFEISKILKKVIYVCGILDFPISIFLTRIHEGNYFITDGNFSVVNFSTAVFVFLLHKEYVSNLENSQRKRMMVEKLSMLSFGIYLVHPAILGYVNDYLNRLDIWCVWKSIICFGIVTIISAFICILFKRIPIIKRVM